MTDHIAFWNDPANAHWAHIRGEGKWADDRRWRAVGEYHRNLLADEFGFALCAPRMLEWGPGGGSNLVALEQYAEEMYGVDISKQSLETCSELIGRIFRPVRIFEPEEALARVPEVGVLICTACIQHMPGREYAERAIAVMCKLLAPSGIALFQFRTSQPERPGEYATEWPAAATFSTDEACAVVGKQGLHIAAVHYGGPAEVAAPDYVYILAQRVIND